MKKEVWFFSFGQGQTHPVTGLSLGNRYVRIEADSHEAARLTMVRNFGQKWCHQYASAEEAGVEEFGLTELWLEESAV